MDTVRVLLVEDNTLVSLVTEGVFGEVLLPATYTHSANLAQALGHQHKPFDLVVCDLLMPGSEPAQVQREITQHFRKAALIFFSASLDRSHVTEVHNQSVLLLSKGVTLHTMRTLMNAYCPDLLPKRANPHQPKQHPHEQHLAHSRH